MAHAQRTRQAGGDPAGAQPDYAVRRLEPGDAGELLRFYRALPGWIVHWYDPFPQPNEQRLAEHLRAAANGEAISYGLCGLDGAVHGHSFILGTRAEQPVFGIGLAEHAIGRGHGRRLMETVISEADALCMPLVTLTVFKDNDRARLLYERFGFTITGEASCRSPGDSHAMRRTGPRRP